MARVSVIADRQLRYPPEGDDFSPDVSFPEYRWPDLSQSPNPVYGAVRKLFAQALLDAANCGTPAWNPLREYVPAGSRVFVLCNFVQHRRSNETPENFRGKCIHGSVLRPLLDYILMATGERGSVTFGNAALQSCRWEQVLRDSEADRVLEFFHRHGAPITARDLRMAVQQRDLAGRVIQATEREPNGDLVSFDLGGQSLLQELGTDASRLFRVSDYNPALTQRAHADGRHVYRVHRAVLDADVVISLVKLKTHEKVGLTCGLKGFVGTIGHKNCLAHHRFGSPAEGGDEYPTANRLRRALSRFHDRVNEVEQIRGPRLFSRAVDVNLRRILSRLGAVQFGSWYGNDTAWRMALDAARIAIYGHPDGTMAETPQRRHLLVVDGIVGGEGRGPLSPTAVPAGVLLFADDVAVGDWACALAMGFDPRKLAITREAFRAMPYRISDAAPAFASAAVNGVAVPLGQAQLSTVRFRPPRHWVGHV